MIKEELYSVKTNNYIYYVIANSYADAEQIARTIMKDDAAMKNSKIFGISREGAVYRPKTKTITIDV